MGSGRNGTFDKTPDLQQWAILTVDSREMTDDRKQMRNDRGQMTDDRKKQLIKGLYGSFIAKWLHFFKCSTYTYLLTPIEGHGLWDGKEVFGKLPVKSDYNGKIAVLTRATIRIAKLRNFWHNVDDVAQQMAQAPGFITSYGIGEVPWIKQATFSIWESKKDMQNFAYTLQQHKDVIIKTRKEKWYSEDMFVRFMVDNSIGGDG